MQNAAAHSTLPWTICLQDLIIPSFLGIFEEERKSRQNIRISLRVSVSFPVPTDAPSTQDVLCYKTLVEDLKAWLFEKKTYLLEVLVEEIAQRILRSPFVVEVWVCVEKMDVFQGNPRVSLEIQRRRSSL